MDGHKSHCCPKCGKELRLDASGDIGWCSVHKEWFAVKPGAESEAAKKNEEQEYNRQQKILQREAEKVRIEADERQAAHSAFVKKLITVSVIVIFVVVVVSLLIVRPAIIYNNAVSLFITGKYEQSLAEFQAIENHKDASDYISLCNYLISLEQGTDSLEDLSTLIGQDLSEAVKAQILSIVKNWQSYAIEPEKILYAFSDIEAVDISEGLNLKQLYIDLHIALLGKRKYAFADDIDNDGQDELISLSDDYDIACYEMLPDGNQRSLISDDVASSILKDIGDYYFKNSKDDAAGCYLSAYHLTASQEIADCISELADSYPLGLKRIELRIEALSMYEDTSLQYAMLDADLNDIFVSWQVLGISPEDMLSIIRIACSYTPDLTKDIFPDGYRRIALAASDCTDSSYVFVDWDEDRFEELLHIQNNNLDYWRLIDAWVRDSSENIGFAGGTIIVPDPDIKQIVILSDDESSFSLFEYDEDIKKSFYVDSIKNVLISKDAVSYEKELKGSIERSEKYEYKFGKNQLVRTNINWPDINYPYPDSAVDTVQRWLETIAYGNIQEKMLLEESECTEIVPVPVDVSSITITPYAYYDDVVFVEARYIDISGNPVILDISVNHVADLYKISSVIRQFAETEGEVLALNDEYQGQSIDKDSASIFRVIVPSASAMTLIWQSGNNDRGNTIYNVSLFKDDISNEPIVSYDLQALTARQQSFPIFTSPGLYFISVRALANNAPDFSIELVSEVRDSIETEPNDSFATAQVIETGIECSASLLNREDVDVFNFNVDNPAKLSVILNAEEDGNRRTRYEAAIYDAETYICLGTLAMTGIDGKVQSQNLYLSEGEYYLTVSAGDYYTGSEYSFIINEESCENQETEQNGNRSTADDLNIGTVLSASFGTEGDSDWYRFELPYDAKIDAILNFIPIDTASRAYTFSILDESSELFRGSITGRQSDVIIDSIVLPKGTYYARLDDIIRTQYDYTLCINAEEVEKAEEEPNDSASTANDILLDVPISGSLLHENDVDYFRLIIPDRATYNLDFSFSEQHGNNSVFIVTIEQDGATLWRQNIRSSSGGFAQPLLIEPGTYYVRIRPSSWNDVLYTLQIAKQEV